MMSDHVGLQNIKNLIQVLFCMNAEIDRLRKIQAEDTHDRLGIDNVSSGYQVEVIIKFGDIIYKSLDLVDGIKRNLYCLHSWLTSKVMLYVSPLDWV